MSSFPPSVIAFFLHLFYINKSDIHNFILFFLYIYENKSAADVKIEIPVLNRSLKHFELNQFSDG